MKTHIKTLLAALTAAAFIGATSTSHAATVIFTEDFESPTTTNTDPLPAPDGWDLTRGRTDIIGLFDQENSGDQQFYGFTGQAWTLTTTDTILSDTVTTGLEHTLSFLYWSNLSSRGIGFTAQLLAIDGSNNETVLATDSFDTEAPHGFNNKATAATFTLSVTPTTNAGERLAVRLTNNGPKRHTMIDDVELTVVPEPGSLALLGLGGLLIGARRRRG